MLAVAGAIAGAAGSRVVEGRRATSIKMQGEELAAPPPPPDAFIPETGDTAPAEESAPAEKTAPAPTMVAESTYPWAKLFKVNPVGTWVETEDAGPSWGNRIPMLDTRPGVAMSTDTQDDLKVLAKELNPIVGFYDPLNLSKMEFWEQSNGATISFLRHSEIKHGRVAMAGFVGFIIHANGIHFPWKIPGDELCAPGVSPALLWDNMPFGAKLQIILAIGLFEAYSEAAMSVSPGQGGHYMRGGKPGYFPPFKLPGGGKSGIGILEDEDGKPLLPHYVPFNLYDPFNLNKDKSDEWKAQKLTVELNNGRLAMLGLMSLLSESAIPGSVPALNGLIPESGVINVMRPFFFQASLFPSGMESMGS
jgi:hypothetical protein